MKDHVMLHRGLKSLQRTWAAVTHIVDDVEPDRFSSVAPLGADGTRVKPFCQNR